MCSIKNTYVYSFNQEQDFIEHYEYEKVEDVILNWTSDPIIGENKMSTWTSK